MDLGGVWDNWSEDETRLFDQALGNIADEYGEALTARIHEDEWVGFLYHEAMWDFDLPGDMRGTAYEAFVQYMEDYFGVEWEDVYDWEAYREAYDAA